LIIAGFFIFDQRRRKFSPNLHKTAFHLKHTLQKQPLKQAYFFDTIQFPAKIKQAEKRKKKERNENY